MSYLISAKRWTNSTIYIPEYPISTCCIITTRREFTLLQYSTTLKHNRIILYHIWYLLQYSTIYIPEYSQISTCCIEFNHRREFTLLQFSTTLKHNRIILYHIWILLHDEPTVLYISHSQYWFQHAALNLITTRLTLLQFSTTLLSIIASFCIIFDFCYMMNQQYYI